MKRILALSVCIHSCYAADHHLPLVDKSLFYGPRLNLSADYQNKSRSFLFFDGFLPFSGDNQNIWFADLRFLNREKGADEGNLGLGYRHQLDDHPWIAGAYGFFDRRLSFDRNYFSELTLGGELKGTDWSLGTNVYVPVGKTVKADPYAYNAILTPSDTNGIYNIYYNQGKEAALAGFDVEVGHTIPKIPGLTAYVGGYGYPSAHGVSSRVGPLVRAEYNLSDSGLLGKHPLMDSTVLEGFMRHDDFIGTSYYLGLRFSLNLDGTPRYEMDPLHRRMVDPVWRDIDLITASDAHKTPILDVKANGTPVTVAIASTYPQLQNYINQGIDVVGVNGVINTTPGPIVMQNNQTLTGGVYEFIPGRTIPVGTQGTLFSSANDQAIVQVAKNDTIEHLTFNMTGVNKGGSFVNQAITNYHSSNMLYHSVGSLTVANNILQNSVGRLTIAGNTLNNSGIDLVVADGSKDSIFNITDNQITALNQGLGRTLNTLDINAIKIQAKNNSTIRIAHLDRNKIDLSVKAEYTSNFFSSSAINVGLSNKSSLVLDSLQNNTINLASDLKLNFFNTSDNSSTGIELGGYGAIQAAHILGNQVMMNTKELDSDVEAFVINATALDLYDVAYNRAIINSYSSVSRGMDFTGGDVLNITKVNNNFLQINAKPSNREGYGFQGITTQLSRLTGIGRITNISNNEIEIPITGRQLSGDYGIELDMPTGSGSLTVNNILNNHIVLKPFDDGSYTSDGLFPIGIFIGSPICDHNDNTNTLIINNVKGNVIETKSTITQTGPQFDHAFFGIFIETLPNDPHTSLDNVHVRVSNISDNIINTQVTGVANKVRGIEILNNGQMKVENVTNNTININAPQSLEAAGIIYKTGLEHFINAPDDGLFTTNNTSYNKINLVSGRSAYGIWTVNNGTNDMKNYGYYNNVIHLTGTQPTTYGLYFTAFGSSFGTHPRSLHATGIEGNNIFLGSQGTGIFAYADKKYTVTLIANPNQPSLSLSAANGGTSYGTGGQGTKIPAA